MFAPAGQTTARAGQLCWLAALVVRRQAVLTPPRGLRCRILPRTDMESAPTVQERAAYMRPLHAAPGKGLLRGEFPERSRPLPTWHP